jgi:hypothetical protein
MRLRSRRIPRAAVCPHCGHPLSDDEVEVVLTRPQRKLFRALKDEPAGMTNDDLMNSLYADDPGGGALETNVIAVMAYRMRKALEPFGLTIRCKRGGRGARYHLEEKQ